MFDEKEKCPTDKCEGCPLKDRCNGNENDNENNENDKK